MSPSLSLLPRANLQSRRTVGLTRKTPILSMFKSEALLRRQFNRTQITRRRYRWPTSRPRTANLESHLRATKPTKSGISTRKPWRCRTSACPFRSRLRRLRWSVTSKRTWRNGCGQMQPMMRVPQLHILRVRIKLWQRHQWKMILRELYRRLDHRLTFPSPPHTRTTMKPMTMTTIPLGTTFVPYASPVIAWETF